jgi:DUF4097 and DUF4098 domain-containing protein YvlB
MIRRTRWKTAARLAAGVAAAAVVMAATARADERSETFEKRAPLDGAKRVVVKNARGDVFIEGEAGRGDIRCEYEKQARGRKRDEIERVFGAMDVEVRRSGDDLVIEAVYPKRKESDRGLLSLIMQQYTSMRIDMRLRVPAAAAVVVAAGSGDVEVAGLEGAVEISASSGDITARRIGGALEIQVSSGDIVVADVAGPVELSAASGDISVRRVAKSVVVQSASGDVDAADIGGDLAIASTSGDVEVSGVGSVEFRGTSGDAAFAGVRGGVIASISSGTVTVVAAPAAVADYTLASSSGGIVLAFEKELPGGFALKAQTTTGEITVSLPIKLHKVSRRYLAGIVGEGKSIVAIETSSGNITITGTGK